MGEELIVIEEGLCRAHGQARASLPTAAVRRGGGRPHSITRTTFGLALTNKLRGKGNPCPARTNLDASGRLMVRTE